MYMSLLGAVTVYFLVHVPTCTCMLLYCILPHSYSPPCSKSSALSAAHAAEISSQLSCAVPVLVQQLCHLHTFRRRALQPATGHQ